MLVHPSTGANIMNVLSTAPRSRRRRPLQGVVATIVWVILASVGEPAEIGRRVLAMGGVLEVAVKAEDRETALEASQACVLAVDAAERRLSTWRDDSELALLNRTEPGEWAPLSPELARDLGAALHWWRATGGAFDPGVGSLVRTWDLRGRGRVPDPQELAVARAGTGARYLEIDGRRARRLLAGLILEEGGFGKGVALRDGARAAMAAGAVCVVLDFGGQVELAGDCADHEITIADPLDRSQGVATLHLREGSIATSGNSERGITVEGIRYGHLLDPRSGRPAADWGSVTVLAEDPVAADCLATALYVMGPEDGAAWLEEQPGLEAVFAVVGDGGGVRLHATPGLRAILR